MKQIITLVITVILFTVYGTAQVYIEPVIGYQTDLNNKKSFQQINSAVQLAYKVSKYYGLVVQLQKGWALASTAADFAFSANPALPVTIAAKKTMRPSALSFTIGHRITVAGKNSANIFSVILYSGVTAQKIAVTYEYDKNNYTILNPDQTQKRISGIFSGGVEYMRLLKIGRLFAQFIAASEPVGKKIKYPSSFDFMAPMAFNIGYSIPVKNYKHEN
jgi:hypothetical protein